MLEEVILDNGKGSQKLKIKTDMLQILWKVIIILKRFINFMLWYIGIKKKILQWSYNIIASKLLCDNFKLLKLTFSDISKRNELSSK